MEDFIFGGSYTHWIANVNEKLKLHLDMHVLWNCPKKSTLILQFPNLTAYEGGVHLAQLLYNRVSEAANFLNIKL